MADDGPPLRHFWVELGAEAGGPSGTAGGIGVTATDPDDLVHVLRDAFGDAGDLSVRTVSDVLDFSALDPWLVLPNMAEPWARGVWYPAKPRPRRG